MKKPQTTVELSLQNNYILAVICFSGLKTSTRFSIKAQYFQQIPSSLIILPKISCQSYDIVVVSHIGAFLYKNSNNHAKKGNTRKGSLISFSFAKLTFLPRRAIVSCISYRVTRVRVTKVVMIRDDLLTQSTNIPGNGLAGLQRVH